MKTIRRVFLLGLLGTALSKPAQAALNLGQAAPDFSLPASNAKSYHLAEWKGHFIVLEWFNRDCPFTRKHYETKNMQTLQEKYVKKGVIWFSILSSAPGKEGYLDATQANLDRISNHVNSTATLLDPDGTVGRLYQAKTTPHMYVIDPKGNLIYAGAIDDKPTADKSDVSGATNYVAEALNQAMSHKKVKIPATLPYGCSVKYQ